jgi:hypothetical protein
MNEERIITNSQFRKILLQLDKTMPEGQLYPLTWNDFKPLPKRWLDQALNEGDGSYKP